MSSHSFFLDGQDYVGFDQHTLTFPSGSSSGATECVNISVMDDKAFEKDEVFTVHLVDFEEGIIADTSYIEVIINDDEGIKSLSNQDTSQCSLFIFIL